MDQIGAHAKIPRPSNANSSLFQCVGIFPKHRRVDNFGYAFCDTLKGSRNSLGDLANQPEIFDSSRLEWNAHGGLELLPELSRHMGNNIVFADGHLKVVPAKRNAR
jgi:prepilin-type processing-associated H-X9-DG protein